MVKLLKIHKNRKFHSLKIAVIDSYLWVFQNAKFKEHLYMFFTFFAAVLTNEHNSQRSALQEIPSYNNKV